MGTRKVVAGILWKKNDDGEILVYPELFICGDEKASGDSCGERLKGMKPHVKPL